MQYTITKCQYTNTMMNETFTVTDSQKGSLIKVAIEDLYNKALQNNWKESDLLSENFVLLEEMMEEIKPKNAIIKKG